MLYLENNTTFSGADIQVYVYKHIDDFNNLGFKNMVDGNRVKKKREFYDSRNGRGVFDDYDLTDTEPGPDGKGKPGIGTMIKEAQEGIASGRIKAKPPTYTVEFNDGNSAPTEGISKETAQELVSTFPGATMKADPPIIDGSAVQTNRVNPNYIDILNSGSDKAGLDLARKYQLSKINSLQNKNRRPVEDDASSSELKPIIEIGSLYSITYSSFREKVAVRTLGRVSAKDYTRGQRTIAGSMNFVMFQSHDLMDFLRGDKDIVLVDQLPKFNMMLLMINEYGGASILHLFGVTISTESQQTSVNDLALMNSLTFYAEDIMTLDNVGNAFETSLSMLHPSIIAGRSLQFYNRGTSSTLEDLLEANQGQDSNIKKILDRSRGLF